MQNFRQISLIGLRGCFPVVHLGNTAWPIDVPVFLFSNHALPVIDLPVASSRILHVLPRCKISM